MVGTNLIRNRSVLAFPLCRDTMCMPYGRHNRRIKHATLVNIYMVLRTLWSKRVYLQAKWAIDPQSYQHDGIIWCAWRHESWKWFADKFGIDDLFSFLGDEFIRFCRDNGRYEFSSIARVLVYRRWDDIWVKSIDCSKGVLHLTDESDRIYEYNMPEDISSGSSENIGGLDVTWGALTKAMGVMFFLGVNKEAFLALVNGMLQDEVVFYFHVPYISSTKAQEDYISIYSLDKHGRRALIEYLHLKMYVSPRNHIYFPIDISVPDEYSFLQGTNLQGYDVLRTNRAYYHPVSRSVVLDFGERQAVIKAEASMEGVKVPLGEGMWIGVSKWQGKRERRLTFSLYADTSKAIDGWANVKEGRAYRFARFVMRLMGIKE